MPSTAGTTYQDGIEGKLITAVTTATTTGVKIKLKVINGETPTAPTTAYRLHVLQRTATSNKHEIWGVAAGSTQSGQTVTLGTITRALPLDDGTDFTGSGVAQSFAAGADVFLSWDAHDAAQTLKADIVNTITGSGAIRGSSTTVPILRLNNVTTAQRNAMTPSNGDAVYDTDLNQAYDYAGGAWAARAAGVNSNAANGTGGKVDLATAAEVAAGTSTDATSGSPNVIPVSIVKTNSTGAVNGTVPALNSAVALDVSIGGTGRTSVTTGSLLVGAGTSAMTIIGPGTSGQVPLSNGTTIAMADVPQNHDVRSISASDSSTVGAGVSSENNMNTTYTIPANDWAVGAVYKVTAAVIHKVPSGNVTLKLKLGSTALFTTSAISTAGTTGTVIEGYMVCRSTGGSGTIQFFGFRVGSATQEASVAATTTPASNPTTIDTTATQVVQLSAQFSGTDATQGALVSSLIVSKLTV